MFNHKTHSQKTSGRSHAVDLGFENSREKLKQRFYSVDEDLSVILFCCLAQQNFIVPYRAAVTGASEFIDSTVLSKGKIEGSNLFFGIDSVNAIKYINWTLSSLSHKQKLKISERRKKIDPM